MNLLKKIIWQIITVLSFICLVLLIVSAVSDRISPLTTSYIPFLGLFFPFILGINILLFFFWLVTKKWIQFISFLIVFIFCWGPIRTYFPINFSKKESTGESIKVLTYNVMRFEHLRKHTSKSPNPIIEYIVDQDPDIICLQEFGFSLNDKNRLLEKDILNALHKTPYHRVVKFKFPYSDQVFGLAVFSKFPILSVKQLPLESKYNGVCVLDLKINGKLITLINAHLESNKISADERSDYYNLTKEPDTQKLEAFTHMMFQRLTPAYRIRAKQAEIVHDVIANTKNKYVIVCGDFNDTPISFARNKIKGNLLDAFRETGSGMGITFNRHRFLFRIDYILHSKNMKAFNCTVGNLKDSDHYPVWTYLEFLD